MVLKLWKSEQAEECRLAAPRHRVVSQSGQDSPATRR